MVINLSEFDSYERVTVSLGAGFEGQKGEPFVNSEEVTEEYWGLNLILFDSAKLLWVLYFHLNMGLNVPCQVASNGMCMF